MQTYFPIVPITILIVRFIVYAMQQERNVAREHAVQNINTHDAVNINKPVKRRYKMKFFFTRKIKNTDALFNGHFVDVKAFYVLQFDKVPCVCFVGDINVTKAYAHINETFGCEIITVFQHVYFEHDKLQTFFNSTIFVLTEKRMIELAKGYAQILYTPKA
ncbi:MAG TPA: hypothetical protein VN958_22215, partial [Chitinophagaceae bacterium]|nr:hypothetical protein [Chitinophagaceae bacterium]